MPKRGKSKQWAHFFFLMHRDTRFFLFSFPCLPPGNWLPAVCPSMQPHDNDTTARSRRKMAVEGLSHLSFEE